MSNYIKKSLSILFSVFILVNISAFSQSLDDIPEVLTGKVQTSTNDRVMLAMTTTDYLVTAGDVYNLSFLAGNTPISYIINVDPTYRIRVANLAVLNVANTSFLSLKKQVEEIVTKNYPMSGVQFNLVSPGSFKVIVKGEVKEAVEADAWALTRLSEVVNTYKNKFASERDITLIRNGKYYSYDLFKAKRYGDFDSDPYLRPGDVVTLNPTDRRVTITGAVERPGTYELLKGESLVDLVAVYGHGLLPMADTSRIEVTQVYNQTNKSGQKVYLTSVDPKYNLNNYDSVFIPTYMDLKPIVFVEGAILLDEKKEIQYLQNPPKVETTPTNEDVEKIKENKDNKVKDVREETLNQSTSTTNTISAPLSPTAIPILESNRKSVKIDEGTNYASFVRSHADWFTSNKSDIDNAYIIRGDERIGINLRDILYDNSYYSNLVVENNDTLLVPFKQTYVVTVTGEVTKKGEVPTTALTRLSSVIDSVSTPFSSHRDITIKSIDGGVKTCDLYKASRDGDLSFDPYLKPGDEVYVGRIDRKVTITGAVERPGTYELLKNENIEALIYTYGNGLLPTADTTRIEVTKVIDSENKTGEKLYFKEIDKNFKLSNYDTVFIPNYGDLKPIVFVEGAIYTEESEMKDSIRIPVRFSPGLNYASFIRNNETWFSSTKSDIDNAYVVRGEQRIDINIRKILYDRAFFSDLTVEPNDILTVPFKQTYIVYVDGEVSICGEVPINAFTRLSTVVESVSTPYSSSRNVVIRSTDGEVKQCDLFKATRDGDLTQNPYLKPSDKITIGRLDRKVTINGAIERPGTYELLEGENLKELVEKYGHGLTPLADTSRIKVTKILDSKNVGGEVAYLREIDTSYPLNCYDEVEIGSYQELKPIVFIEGAIGGESSETELKGSDRVSIRFDEGLNYSTFIRENQELFTAKSDLENAYIIRNQERISINLEQILFDKSYYSDLEVKPYDTLLVPFKQRYISVAGAVAIPGRYPYIPDRTYEYYIGVAGGFIDEKNTGKAVEIVDRNGNKLSKGDIIPPESTITAKANSFTYYFNIYAPIITTLLGLVSTSVSLGMIFKK